MESLTNDELMVVNGGLDYDSIATGLSIEGGGILAAEGLIAAGASVPPLGAAMIAGAAAYFVWKGLFG